MTCRIAYATDPLYICRGQRVFANPPTEDGADVEGWTSNDGRSLEKVHLTVLAGDDVAVASGAIIVAEETHDTYPEEEASVTCTNATEIVNLTAHGFYTGDGPVWLSADVVPAGYVVNTDYYVIRVASGTLKLAATRADALAGTALAITTDGTNVVLHWLTNTKSTSQDASSVSTTVLEEWFAFAAPHGVETGTRVQVANSGGALPTGLVANTDYYAIAVNSTHVAFATTEQNAEDDVRINLTAAGSGTQSLISDNTGPVEATVYIAHYDINEGYAFDLTADIGMHFEFCHRPGAEAYHLVLVTDSPTPITAFVRQVREFDEYS